MKKVLFRCNSLCFTHPFYWKNKYSNVLNWDVHVFKIQFQDILETT